MDNPFFIALASWLFPGAGHLIQKRWKRGIIISVVIWAMFIVAIAGGGAYYPGFNFKEGALLYLLDIFARFGNGLGAIVSYIIAASPDPTVAARATFEYSGRFLECAGLLNYLAAMDAVDIFLGRKK